MVFTATRRRLGVVQAPENAVAVEDSASGVGSASNANVGFIVGYVGGTHVAPSLKESHARMLMRGERATSGRGAEIVIEDMKARLGSHFMPHHTQMLTVQLFLQSAALHGGTPGNVISQVRSAIKKLRIVRLGFGTS